MGTQTESKTQMSAMELAKLAQKMRNAQAAYFRRKTSEGLELAKDLERQVDHTVAELLEGPRLF